jgi:hypothetical protein
MTIATMGSNSHGVMIIMRLGFNTNFVVMTIMRLGFSTNFVVMTIIMICSKSIS